MEKIIEPLTKINPSYFDETFFSLFRTKQKLFSRELVQLVESIKDMDTTVEFLTIINKKGIEYAKEWLKYKLSIIDPVDPFELDGGQLTLTKRPRHVIVFEHNNKKFEVPCKVSNNREIKRFSSFVWVDGKYFDTKGNEINGLPHFLYYRGHYKGEHFFRDWKDGDHYFCLNKNGVVVRYMKMPPEASTRIRSTIRIVNETNLIVVITDTRCGRDIKSTHYDDLELVKSMSLIKTKGPYGFPSMVYNYFDGTLRRAYPETNLRTPNGFYCVFRDTPSDQKVTVLNIKTNEEKIYEIPPLYINNSFFVDSDGTLMTRHDNKIVNLTDPTQEPFDVPTKLFWGGVFSNKYVFCFNSSRSHIEVFDRRNLLLLDTIRISSVSDYRDFIAAWVYTEESLRIGNTFFDINSNKKKQLAELYKVLPKEIVEHIAVFILF